MDVSDFFFSARGEGEGAWGGGGGVSFFIKIPGGGGAFQEATTLRIF